MFSPEFQAVAEELSYARASRRLRVAQPALSRAINEIEAALGAAVLERSRHHVRLTPAGTVLLRETALLLERWEESMRRVRRTAAGEVGELRLGYVRAGIGVVPDSVVIPVHLFDFFR